MRVNREHWLYKKPVAHRGLHGNGIPENSLAAFKNAVESGYAFEIDLHLTTDGKVVVYHDDDLKRMTGAEGDIRDKSFEELSGLRLKGTEEKIPLFTEVLEQTDGKEPILIEIKSQKKEGIESAVIELLKGYTGEYAIQAFDPFILKKFKKLAPDMLRGQLSCTYSWDKNMKRLRRYTLSHMKFNFLTKPDFISYCNEDLPKKCTVKKGLPLLAWTIRDEKAHEHAVKYADNIIFENIRP